MYILLLLKNELSTQKGLRAIARMIIINNSTAAAIKNIKYTEKPNTKGAPNKSPNIVSRSVVPNVFVMYRTQASIIAHKVKMPGIITKI